MVTLANRGVVGPFENTYDCYSQTGALMIINGSTCKIKWFWECSLVNLLPCSVIEGGNTGGTKSE